MEISYIYSKYRNETLQILAVLAFTLCGLSLRMKGLEELGLGFDELMHIYPAKSLLEIGEPILPSGIIYERALFFTYTVALSFKLCGISELSARLPSVGFGTASIILIYIVGRSLFSSRVGLIAAFILMFVPYEIVWARASRMYSMYQFFYLLAFYSFYQCVDSRESQIVSQCGPKKVSIQAYITDCLKRLHIGWGMATVFAFLIAIHLHIESVIFSGSILVYAGSMIFLSVKVPHASSQIRTKYLALFIMLMVTGLGTILWPGVLEVIISAQKFSPSWAEGQVLSISTYFKFLMMPSLLPILLFFILGIYRAITQFNNEAYYTVISACLPLVIHSLFVNVQSPRYIYGSFPFIILVASWSINNIMMFVKISISNKIKTHKISPRIIRGVSWCVTVCLIVLICLGFYPGFRIALNIDRYQASDFGGQYHAQWREACEFVMERFVEGEVIIASIPLNAEFSGCRHVEYNLDNGEIEKFFSSDDDGLSRHIFADAKAIMNIKGFETVLARHPNGWILLDGQRFHNNANIPRAVSTLISQNLTRQATMADETIYVFHWTDQDRQKMLVELIAR